jgi:ABC-2 type transport system ATP-binding protein/capsular polysaccharide transport system ATP-binding protein
MILVSHEVNYIKDHCNRFAVLDQGRLEFYDSFDHAYGTFCTIMTSAPA